MNKETAMVLSRNAQNLNRVDKVVFDFADDSRGMYQVEIITVEDYEGSVMLRNDNLDFHKSFESMIDLEKEAEDMINEAIYKADTDYVVKSTDEYMKEHYLDVLDLDE